MNLDLSQFSAVFLDLDGTICEEENILPGVVELGAKLRAMNIPYAICSNSTYSSRRVMERLHRMRLDISQNQIYTAAAAACDYATQKYTAPCIFNLATEGVEEMLKGKASWVESPTEKCDAVIVGTPSNVYATEERQRIALDLLRNGADLIGICADRIFPSPRGIEFGSGALTSMLAYAANTKPTFCGKPERIFFESLCTRLNLDPTKCVLIGDNLESDIVGGKSVGMRTILTLTGVTTREECERAPSDQRADWIIDNLQNL